MYIFCLCAQCLNVYCFYASYNNTNMQKVHRKRSSSVVFSLMCHLATDWFSLLASQSSAKEELAMLTLL